jgi:hypothetical protein
MVRGIDIDNTIVNTNDYLINFLGNIEKFKDRKDILKSNHIVMESWQDIKKYILDRGNFNE